MLGQASKLCTPHSAPHAPALHRRPPLSPGRLPVGRYEREARLHWLLYTESGATFPHLWLVSSGAQVPSRVGERSFLRSKQKSQTWKTEQPYPALPPCFLHVCSAITAHPGRAWETPPHQQGGPRCQPRPRWARPGSRRSSWAPLGSASQVPCVSQGCLCPDTVAE